jgi:hypothetical protein
MNEIKIKIKSHLMSSHVPLGSSYLFTPGEEGKKTFVDPGYISEISDIEGKGDFARSCMVSCLICNVCQKCPEGKKKEMVCHEDRVKKSVKKEQKRNNRSRVSSIWS